MTFEDEYADRKEIPMTIENDEEVIFIKCWECDGSGIYAKATRWEPADKCDACEGNGGYEKVVKSE